MTNLNKKVTFRDATRKWTGEWNAIPSEVVALVLEKEEVYSPINEEGLRLKWEKDERDGTVDHFPTMWGNMFTFGENLDNDWIEEDDNLAKFTACNIVVYHTEMLGYVFGIDGAGYDFYESHWIPLYKLRGLKWHDEDAEKSE